MTVTAIDIRRAIGFTGPRHLTTVQTRVIEPLAEELVADEYITGACIGLDALIGRLMVRIHPRAKHTVIVPAKRTLVEAWWVNAKLPENFELVFMPDGTAYKDRNVAIVERSTELWAFPHHPEHHELSRRSGTWQTVRIARDKQVPVAVKMCTQLASL